MLEGGHVSSHHLSIDLEFLSPLPRDPEAFDEFLDAIGEEFHKIRDEELDYGGSLTSHIVTFGVQMTASTVDEMARALGDLRTAIHAAGGSTPGWPTDHAVLRTSTGDCVTA